jgi:LysM repeat protein
MTLRRPAGDLRSLDVIGPGPIPRVRALTVGAQPIETATFTPVALEIDVWDTDAIHDAGRDSSRLTARTAGLYVITASFEWEPNPVGWRTAVLKINDIMNIAFDQQLAVNGAETIEAITAQYMIEPGDFVELIVQQNSGRTLNVGGGPNIHTNVSMTWVGP